MSEYHTPVMLNESVSALITNLDGTYIDATFGGGGHTAEILSRLNKNGKVLAFDRDTDAINNKLQDPRLHLIHNNFRFIHNYLIYDSFQENEKDYLNAKTDGILADLGVSSHQFDTAERGFSFRYDAKLDMRMNTEAELNAEKIVNEYSEEDLIKIFKLYGEVDNAKKISNLIIKAREIARINTTNELNNILTPILPKFAEHKVLAKIYQALRIEVNQEMKALEIFLESTTESLKKGGRLVIITYHSLEDRMVKNFIKSGNIEGKQHKDFYGNNLCPFKQITKKPILPSEEEISSNTRARSAKLRVVEKI